MGDQAITINNGAGPFTALNGYVQLANVSGLSASCSFDARVLGNSDTADTSVIRRLYTLTPNSCPGLIADLTLEYEDGTGPDHAPDERNGIATS